MNRTIEITVLADGQTRVETKGFTGAACREASRFLERALGQTTGEQLTTEFCGRIVPLAAAQYHAAEPEAVCHRCDAIYPVTFDELFAIDTPARQFAPCA